MREDSGSKEKVVTLRETAEILGVTPDRVTGLIRNGTLKRVPGNLKSEALLYAADVEALYETRLEGRQGPTSLQIRIATAEKKNKLLEHRIELLERMLGLVPPAVRYDKTEILDFLNRVHEALKEPPTETLEILDWCACLFSIHEELFDLIEAYTSNPEPWVEIMLLAERMYKNSEGRLDDQELLNAYTELAAARRSLRHAVFFYIWRRQGREKATEIIPEVSPDILHKIGKYVR